MSIIVGFGRFWWDFIIGEDWRIAAGVSIVLSVGALLVTQTTLSDNAITLLCGGGVVVLVIGSIVGPALRQRRPNPDHHTS